MLFRLIQTSTLNQNIRAPKIAKTLISGGYYVIFLGWNRGSEIIDKEHWGKKENIKEIQMGLKAPVGLKVVLFYPIWWCFVFLALMIEKWDIAYAINIESVHKDYPLYLISTTHQEELEQIVKERNIAQYLKKVLGIPPGTKIGYISNALKNEGAKPDEAVYIGDMIEDYKIAHAAGVQFIGRRSIEYFGNIDVPVFSDMLEIKKWVQYELL